MGAPATPLAGLAGPFSPYRKAASSVSGVIYLDHNATTPLRSEARAAMMEALETGFANPSSVHRPGACARAAVESARAAVAESVQARPADVIFTSGGTESNNLALFGLIAANERPHLIVSATEHSSVLVAAQELRRRGAELTLLPVDSEGRVSPDDLAASLRGDTVLVSIAWANNEIGTVQPIDALADACARAGVWFHVDAVQALGKVPVDVCRVHLCSLSAHKLGGPKGVGALVVRGGAPVRPLLYGGHQERGVRPGTENVAAIAGFGAAAARATPMDAHTEALRERLWEAIAGLADVTRHSPARSCLPNTLNVGFRGVSGEALVAALDLEGVAVSSGAACAAGAAEPSHVLRAIGCDEESARNGVRFSLGHDTSAADVDAAAAVVARVVRRIRAAHV